MSATSWPKKKIGELFYIGAGKSVTPAGRLGTRRFPFLRTANVFWGRIDLTALDAMNFSDEEIEMKSLRKGDLLVCEGGDIGRAAIWNGEVEIGVHVGVEIDLARLDELHHGCPGEELGDRTLSIKCQKNK